jgi:chloramphenicol-sensitive protein RarD
VPVLEVGAHRIAWGCLTFGVLLVLQNRTCELVVVVRHLSDVAALCVSAALLATNWLIFIFAVAHDRVLEVSLGYFINPFVSVLLGMLVLGERLRRAQWFAVMLAAVGVVQLVWSSGGLPWISMLLALSFGCYGLLRKTVAVAALPGSTVETMILLPIALGFLAWLAALDRGTFGAADPSTSLLLVASGPVTAIPLLWFANAARRLKLSTIGFLQYLAPTGQFVLAVFVFGEPLDPLRLAGFLWIWAALAVFTGDSWLDLHRRPTTERPHLV